MKNVFLLVLSIFLIVRSYAQTTCDIGGNIIVNPSFECLTGAVNAPFQFATVVEEWDQSCASTVSPYVMRSGSSFGTPNEVGIPDNYFGCTTQARGHTDPTDPYFNQTNEVYAVIMDNTGLYNDAAGIRGELGVTLTEGLYEVSFWAVDIETPTSTCANGSGVSANVCDVFVNVSLVRNNSCAAIDFDQVAFINNIEEHPDPADPDRMWRKYVARFCLETADNPSQYTHIEFKLVRDISGSCQTPGFSGGLYIDDLDLSAVPLKDHVIDISICGDVLKESDVLNAIDAYNTANGTDLDASDYDEWFEDNGNGVFFDPEETFLGTSLSAATGNGVGLTMTNDILFARSGTGNCTSNFLTIQVTKNPFPAVTAVDQEVCKDDVVILDGRTWLNSGQDPNDHYFSWAKYDNGTWVFQVINEYFTIPTDVAGTFVYQITVSNQHGCTVYVPFQVVVRPPVDMPSLSIPDITCFDTETAIGPDAQFWADLFDDNEGLTDITIDWGDGSQVQLDPNLFVFMEHHYAQSGQYSITVTASNVCGSASVVSNTFTIINIPDFTISADQECGNVTLTATVINQGTMFDHSDLYFTWKDLSDNSYIAAGMGVDQAMTFNECQKSIELTVTIPTPYNCDGTKTIVLNCDATIPPVEWICNFPANPNIVFRFRPGNTWEDGFYGISNVIIRELFPTTDSELWDIIERYNGPLPNEMSFGNPCHAAWFEIEYTLCRNGVMVTETYNYTPPPGFLEECCGSFEDVFNGIEDKDDLRVQIYPNPASNQLTIQLDAVEGTARIFSVNGKEMMVNMNLTHGANQIDVSSLPEGMYLVEIGTAQGSFTQKFLKE